MPERKPNCKGPAVAYILSAWPRVSETFILNEVIAVERAGVPLRIFSLKEPSPAPVHPKTQQMQAPFTCLAEALRWRRPLGASLRLLSRHPVRYFRALREAIRYRCTSGAHRFMQAVCLADVLRQEPVSHLHAHFANAPAVVAMLAHELTGIPYTFTAHAKDLYVKTPPELLGAEIQHARAVVTCTEYNRRYLLTRFSSQCDGKLRLIYHGLDLSEFNFRWPPATGEGPPVILSVARLVEKKGLGDLISAACLLKKKGRHFRVEIIGDGPMRDTLTNQVFMLGLEDRIKLLGALPHEAVREAYARASAFALPCVVAADGDRDGIPNVLLESMASGAPVVSTTVSGIPELVDSERDGLLVPPSEPVALAGALDRLLGQPELSERLARVARAKIEERFSLESGASELMALFQGTNGQ